MQNSPCENLSDVTILANMRIDTSQKLQYFKDSFLSFPNGMFLQWVVNIRGKLKHDAAEFIKKQKIPLLRVSHVETRRGWHRDFADLASYVDTQYVFIWLEDHMCVATDEVLCKTIEEFILSGADIMPYSGLNCNTRGYYKDVPSSLSLKFHDIYALNAKTSMNYKMLHKKEHYLFTLTVVLKKSALLDHLSNSNTFIRHWPASSPFDFERRCGFLKKGVLFFAYPKSEIFACIDDDMGVSGYSLVSRNEYKDNFKEDISKKKEMRQKGVSEGKSFVVKLFLFFAFKIKRFFYSVFFFIK